MNPKNIVIKIAMGILFGFLIMSFAIWGIGDIFRSGTQTQVIAQVGDRGIGQREFSRDLSRLMVQTSQRLGTSLTGEQAQSLGLVQQTLQRLIGQALVAQKADDLGIIVTEEQVKARILEEPGFQDEFGNFSRVRFQQTLQINNLSEDAFVADMKQDLAANQFIAGLTSGATAPRALAAELYAYENERRIAEYAVVRTADLDRVADPSDEELQTFYDANQSRFMSPEFRSITMLRLDPETFAKDIGISEEQLRAEFESHYEDFVVPELRTVEQIVFDDQAAAQAAAERINAGEDFAAVAEELTGQPPISLGAVEQGDLLPELGAPVFALQAETVSDPIATPLGWHLVRVTEIAPRQEAEFDSVKAELSQDLAMNQAVEDMISVANQVDDELAGGATLEEVAAQLNVPLIAVEAIDRDLQDREGNPVAGLPQDGAFDQALAETPEGETSLLTETEDGGYFVLRIDGVSPAAPQPLEMVRENAVELWREAEQQKQAAEEAKKLAEAVRAGEDFSALATEMGLALKTTEPVGRFDGNPAGLSAPQLAGRLFQLAPGEIATIGFAGGEIVARLIEIVQADPSTDLEALATAQRSLSQAMRGELLEELMLALQQDYGVDVNSTVLQQVVDTY